MKSIVAGLCCLFAAGAATVAGAVPDPALAGAVAATLVLRSDDDEAAFLGSGLVWGDDGLALTNAHVVGEAASVVVEDRAGRRVAARVLARDMRRDIAVLALPEPRPGLFPAAGQPGIGTPVFALGAPLGLGFSVTSGIVAASPRQIEAAVPLRLIQHDAALNPGSSGGPLIDAEGRLVGMNSQIADGSRLFVGISYAIAADDLARLVPALLGGTLAPVAELGIDLRPVDARLARAMGVAPGGVLVDDVLPGGAAAAAGLRPGDIVLAVGGDRLADPGDLAFRIEAAGGTARLSVLRDGAAREVAVALRGAPAGAGAGAVPPPAPPLTLAGLHVVVDGAARVTAIGSDSAPARAGLAEGDRILRLNGRDTTAPALARAGFADAFVLLVERDGRHLHVIVDPWSARQARMPAGGGNRLDMGVARF